MLLGPVATKRRAKKEMSCVVAGRSRRRRYNHFALFQLGDTFPEYQPPAGLDFGLCWAKSLSAAGNAVWRWTFDSPLSKFRMQVGVSPHPASLPPVIQPSGHWCTIKNGANVSEYETRKVHNHLLPRSLLLHQRTQRLILWIRGDCAHELISLPVRVDVHLPGRVGEHLLTLFHGHKSIIGYHGAIGEVWCCLGRRDR